MDEKFDPSKTGGLTANAIVLPVAILVLVMHLIIIALILSVNRTGGEISEVMSDAGTYTKEATQLLAGSSLLSETSTNFVLMPENENGALNTMPLAAYAEELRNKRRGSDVVEKFRKYKVSREAKNAIEEAAKSADYMVDEQIHAIMLICTIYPLPEEEPYSSIPRQEITDAERKMTVKEKRALARDLILGSDYGMNKKNVSEKVNLCIRMIEEDAGQTAGVAGRKLAIYRTVLWVVTVSIMVILLLTFILLYSQIIMPLRRFAVLIPGGEKLDETKGSREVRLVAAAYNSASRKRDALDDILRNAAEKDQLTNLNNRFGYEQYKLEVEKSGSSAAVIIFDVDRLKQTNDKFGHRAGDKLIRDTADSIVVAFGDRDGDNCFRIGGDEFVAIVTDCTERTVNDMIQQFHEEEQVRRISASIGCAYTGDISKTSVKALMDEADKKMYENKKRAHEKADNSPA